MVAVLTGNETKHEAIFSRTVYFHIEVFISKDVIHQFFIDYPIVVNDLKIGQVGKNIYQSLF
jgi:hypothetical protein